MNCVEFDDDRPAVTTGNALTVGMGYEGILREAAAMGLALPNVRAAVCGAAGNIGQVYARLLAATAGSLVLVGRSGSARRLRSVVADVARELAELASRGASGGGMLERFARAWNTAGRLSPGDPKLLDRVEAVLGAPSWTSERTMSFSATSTSW